MTNQKQDRELIDLSLDLFTNRIPFNSVLGLQIESLDYEHPRVRFEMRDELVGNFVRGTLHGGVIASALDVTGGLAAFFGVQKNLQNEPLEKKIERLYKLGTIDLRVDYLRPGLGRWFECTGRVLRTGRKVAVARVELHNDEETLIAVGTGAYVVG